MLFSTPSRVVFARTLHTPGTGFARRDTLHAGRKSKVEIRNHDKLKKPHARTRARADDPQTIEPPKDAGESSSGCERPDAAFYLLNGEFLGLDAVGLQLRRRCYTW
jgi:hypothetical protein